MPIHKKFFSLLLIFLPTQLGYHFWPDWATVLGRRVDYLSPTIYVTDIFVIVTLVSWFVSTIFVIPAHEPTGFRVTRSLRSVQAPGMTVTILAVFIFIFVNVLFAANPLIAIYKWIKVLEFVLLGYYIVKTKVQLSAISYPLSVGILYSSLIAIGQFYFQHSIGGPLWWLGERTFALDTPGIARVDTQFSIFRLRPYATFPHPNVLGGFLAVVLPLVIASARQRVSASAQWLFRVSFVFGIVALVLTFSRSAIVIGILALAFVFFQKKKIFFFFSILILTFSVFR
ncbi:MAG: hypothetical protein AAB889_01375, partial [Patescibacteria group bacterium]